MLVLTRKPGEKIRIGKHVTLTLLEVNGDRIRLGFEAPDTVRILRAELPRRRVEPAGHDLTER